jgi:hypothetical protein
VRIQHRLHPRRELRAVVVFGGPARR